jgi:hypothetical protein
MNTPVPVASGIMSASSTSITVLDLRSKSAFPLPIDLHQWQLKMLWRVKNRATILPSIPWTVFGGEVIIHGN